MLNIVTISMPFLKRKSSENPTFKPTSWGQLRQTLLGISPQEATFKQRGFLSTHGQTQDPNFSQNLRSPNTEALQEVGLNRAIADFPNQQSVVRF